MAESASLAGCHEHNTLPNHRTIEPERGEDDVSEEQRATTWVHLTGDKDAPEVPVVVEPVSPGRFQVRVGDTSYDIEGCLTESGVSYRHEGRVVSVPVERRGEVSQVMLRRRSLRVELAPARLHALRAALGGAGGLAKPELTSPMAGKVVVVQVEQGDVVETGQTLLVIEAMKMENEIRAAAPATVKAVRVQPGDLVTPGHVLLVFDVESV